MASDSIVCIDTDTIVYESDEVICQVGYSEFIFPVHSETPHSRLRSICDDLINCVTREEQRISKKLVDELVTKCLESPDDKYTLLLQVIRQMITSGKASRQQRCIDMLLSDDLDISDFAIKFVSSLCSAERELGNLDANILRVLAIALAERGASSAHRELANFMLESDSPAARIAAVESLAIAGEEDDIVMLEKIGTSDSSQAVRKMCSMAIEEIREHNED